jgi:2-haloacid dehalogenase
MNSFDTVVFDLGAVLIDWNPKYVYRQLFVTEDAVNHFLKEICNHDWNEQQDAGRTFADATSFLTDIYPHYQSEIATYYNRWEEMLGGPIHPTVDLLKSLRESGKYRLLALTNWSAESFPVALQRYDFLHWFEGILVSGVEKMKKPDPEIFELLIDRYNINTSKTLFIDDNERNVFTARSMGIQTVHFTDHQTGIAEVQYLLGHPS